MSHRHEWTVLWAHFGKYRFARLKGGAHYHGCLVDDCTAMRIGHGRKCIGNVLGHHHVEEHRK